MPNDMLTQSENAKLRKYEDVIQKGLSTFVEVGKALLAIRDEKLYRQEFETWDAYCAKKWGYTNRHAYRLIESAQVLENLSNGQCDPLGHISEKPLPTAERQIREVAKAPPEKQADVWDAAVETAPKGTDGKPKVTAQHVRQTRERVAPEPEKPAPKAPRKPKEHEGITYLKAAEKALGALQGHVENAARKIRDAKKPGIVAGLDRACKGVHDGIQKLKGLCK